MALIVLVLGSDSVTDPSHPFYETFWIHEVLQICEIERLRYPPSRPHPRYLLLAAIQRFVLCAINELLKRRLEIVIRHTPPVQWPVSFFEYYVDVHIAESLQVRNLPAAGNIWLHRQPLPCLNKPEIFSLHSKC